MERGGADEMRKRNYVNFSILIFNKKDVLIIFMTRETHLFCCCRSYFAYPLHSRTYHLNLTPLCVLSLPKGDKTSNSSFSSYINRFQDTNDDKKRSEISVL